MISEQEFLARVSARLGRREPGDAGRITWEPALPLPSVGPDDPELLAQRFSAELHRIGGKAYRVAPEELAARVVQLLAGQHGHVVRWEHPELERLGLDAALRAAGLAVVAFTPGRSSAELMLAAEQAVAGITGCDLAIAETGTLVLGSHGLFEASPHGRGRVVSLLPPVHIAIVYLDQLVYSAVPVFQRLAAAGLPPQVVFASGPSRSADIENDQAIGVHGPAQIHAFLLDSRS